ncbi:MAG: alpha/beta hydrolase [Phycisphaerales bacterium]|nr:alpha/beta hydrolase [Phycisphaerales bacterium]
MLRRLTPALAALTLAILPGMVQPVLAEEEGRPITIGETLTIHSDILGEDREVNIYTPAGFDREKGCPVVYLLDGGFHFHQTTGAVSYLAAADRIPGMMVVGIRNTDRTRDLTPTADPDSPAGEGGEADNFLRFITEELTPWLEDRYGAQTPRVLIGHSFGGLFAIHALRQRPDFFQGIIAISPSMQWDEEALAASAWDWLQDDAHQAAVSSLYITAGNEGMGLLGGSHRLAGALSSHAPTTLRWSFHHMPDESHMSVPYRSTCDGLEWIFEGWDLPDPVLAWEQGGWAAIDSHYHSLYRRLQMEGTVPGSVRNSIVFELVSKQRLDDACAFAADSAERFGPLPSDFWKFIAAEYRDRGDEAGALACCERALEANPRDTWAREQIQQAGGTLPPLPDAYQVDRRLLETYAGVYTFEYGSVTVMVGDAGLEADVMSEHVLLFASSDVDFADDSGTTWTFDVRDGEVVGLTINFGGRMFHLSRNDAPQS